MAGNTISGSLSHAVEIGTGSYSGLLTITNTGTVAPVATAGYNAAIIFNDAVGSGTVNNMGILLGGYDDGADHGGAGIAFISGTGLVINSGTIIGNGSQIDPAAGNGGDGVFLGGVSGSLVNTGFIGGGAGSVGGTGVYMANGVLTNAGTIAAGNPGGYAVKFSGHGTVVADAGGVFLGTVSGSALEVAGTSGMALAGIGSQFVSFTSIDFAPGANRVIEGDVAGLASGQTINGFSYGDTIVLDGFSATAESFNNGGFVLSNASSSVTLDIRGGLNGGVVEAGTLLPIRTISGSVSHSVYVGTGTYATPLTITGTVAPVGTAIDPNDDSAIILEAGSGGGTVDNMGTVVGGYVRTPYGDASPGNGIFIDCDAGFVINSGTIIGNGSQIDAGINGRGGDGVFLGGVDSTLVNTGFIAGGDGGRGQPGSRYDYGSGGAGVYLDNGILVNAGTIAAGVPGRYSSSLATGGYAVHMSPFFQNTLVVDPGAVFLGKVTARTLEVSGTSSTALSGIGSQFVSFSAIDFAAGASWAVEGDVAGLAAGQTVGGFSPGDTIVLDGFGATSGSFVSGVGLELFNGTAGETLDITGGFSSADFVISTRGAVTEISLTDAAPCFCPGTRILTARGNVAVECLKIGDMVKTAGGGWRPVRWIGRRAYDGRFIAGNHLALPVTLRRHALGFNVPSRDLHVSPGHAICEGGVLVHAWRLVNGVSVTQAAAVERVEYFHVELDRHAVIFAENTPVESFFDNGCRAQFQNALGAPAVGVEKRCRPLVEDGYYLARLQARIEARAGVTRRPVMGRLRGYLDQAGPLVCGWAQDEAAPEMPVELALVCGGHVVARCLANRFRADLRAAGLGSGCHAFALDLPPLAGALTIRRVADGAVLQVAARQAA